VAKLKYLGMMVTYQNFIHEKTKSRLNLGTACYHAAENLLSSHLLSKNIKIKIYKIINFPLVLYGYETWCLTLREEHILSVFENRVLRKIFEPEMDEVT
jgi:hypothetical protein